jgi:hypothetical protein
MWRPCYSISCVVIRLTALQLLLCMHRQRQALLLATLMVTWNPAVQHAQLLSPCRAPHALRAPTKFNAHKFMVNSFARC